MIIWMKYKKGKDNVDTDPLSSKENVEEDDSGAKCTTILVIEPTWLEQVKNSVQSSPFF